MKKCVFFDRDGIVNRSPGPGYVERWEDFELLAGFPPVLRLVGQKGYAAIMATNQRGVARGMMTLEELQRIHACLRRLLRERHGVDFLDVFYCPHEEGDCDCRKPRPGMLLKAAAQYGIDLAASWMIGDSENDVEAGRRAGCRTVLVTGPDVETAADHRVGGLAELERLLEKVL
jgi:D-glycero-D-manno-heptose 1,7-bisphosphate phosphatase